MGGSVGVKLNNCESDFFLAGKGLRQGGPISPLLFNLVVDVLTKMLRKAADHSLIAGLCPEVCRGGIICLQYADDTIFPLRDDEESAKNLKFILTAFEQMSGLTINFHKVRFSCLGKQLTKLGYIKIYSHVRWGKCL